MSVLGLLRISGLIVKITGAIHGGEAITMKIPGGFIAGTEKSIQKFMGA